MKAEEDMEEVEVEEEEGENIEVGLSRADAF